MATHRSIVALLGALASGCTLLVLYLSQRDILTALVASAAIALAFIGVDYLVYEHNAPIWQWLRGLALPISLLTISLLALDRYIRPSTPEEHSSVAQIAAAILAGGIVATGSVVAWRRYQLTRDTAVKTHALAERGHITERFTRSIDQLGSRNHDGTPSIEVRLGGIYGLEQIARDSPSLHWSIVEVLTAYVRSNAPSASIVSSLNLDEDELNKHLDQFWSASDFAAAIGPMPEGATLLPREDVQAALTVLGRRGNRELEPQRINLQSLWLAGADMARLDFSAANLSRCVLWYANLSDANLSRSDLKFAYACRMSAVGTSFSDADLMNARFQRSHLYSALFTDAFLPEVNLSGCLLNGAAFTNAFMPLAQLQHSTLVPGRTLGAETAGASFANATVYGSGFAGSRTAGASFIGADLDHASFLDCQIAEQRSDGQVTQTDFSDANLSGASFDIGSCCPIAPLHAR